MQYYTWPAALQFAFRGNPYTFERACGALQQAVAGEGGDAVARLERGGAQHQVLLVGERPVHVREEEVARG